MNRYYLHILTIEPGNWITVNEPYVAVSVATIQGESFPAYTYFHSIMSPYALAAEGAPGLKYAPRLAPAGTQIELYDTGTTSQATFLTVATHSPIKPGYDMFNPLSLGGGGPPPIDPNGGGRPVNPDGGSSL